MKNDSLLAWCSFVLRGSIPIFVVCVCVLATINEFINDRRKCWDGDVNEENKRMRKNTPCKKHKITSIHNKISIIVDKKPSEVGVDPYNKLIDTKSDDNRKKIEEVP